MPTQGGITGETDWLTAALLSPLSIGCLLIFLGLGAALLLLARGLDRLHPPVTLRRNSLRRLFGDEHGTATMEFVLVTPFLLGICAMLAQTTLLMAGNLYVHHAAFAATRTAITMVPLDLTGAGDGPRNVIDSDGGAKLNAIRRSATFAMVPVSGQLESGSAPSEAYVQGMQTYFASAGAVEPNWVTRLLPGKVRYAFANTRAFLYITEVEGDAVYFDVLEDDVYTFGPKDPLTVRVEHDFALTMPWVARMWADDEHTPATGQGWYTTMSAYCTLTNEGINPELPPLPELPRDP